MTTRELAETLNVSTDTITRAANRVLDPSAVVRRVINGGESRVFSEKQATLIKQEIQRHHNLASRQIDSAMTDIEENAVILHAYQILERRVQTYKQRAEVAECKLIEQQPKVEFFDAVAESKDWLDFEQVSKTLCVKGYGRNNLFKFLKDKRVLMGNNSPYQEYVERGYFRLIESTFTDAAGKQRIYAKTVVSQKGVDFVLKMIKGEGEKNAVRQGC